MSSFFSDLFGKEGSVDLEKRALYSRLSLSWADLDRALLGMVLDNPVFVDQYRAYQERSFAHSKEVVVTMRDECRLLETFVSLYQKVSGDGFHVQMDCQLRSGIVFVPPFILFPLVQNALKNGYASMEKYPIKIRLQQTERQVQLEVSNRVNHYVANQGADEIIKYYRHRLDEMFAGRYELFVNSNSNTFKATLFLNYV